MKLTGRIFKYCGITLGIILELFVGFICFYVFLALWGMIVHFGTNSKTGDVQVFVRSNGVHTDICMPVQTANFNWLKILPMTDFSDTTNREYVAIGWGDKGFFMDTPTWSELKVSTACSAMLMPSPTAMHVEYLDISETSETLKSTFISRKQYRQLCEFIYGSFAKKGGKSQLIPGYGYWETDNFYEAHGNYHMFNTCNVWTNDALKAGSIRTSLFSVFPQGNMMHL
jgi:uncharacterized protein (TIGR02117 family)